MDLGEWVLIPDVEFLEMFDKGEKNQEDCWRSFFGDPETACSINKDYFICSSPDSPKPVNYTENASSQLEHSDDDDDEDGLVITISPSIEPNFLPSVIAEKVVFRSSIYDQDDDLLKKLLEYELVDDDVKLAINCSKDSGRRIRRIWTWSFKGFGAICSFSVAAAAICFVSFLNHQNNYHRHKHRHQKLNTTTTTTTMKLQEPGSDRIKKLQFQINDKRIKQVFEQATKLSEVFSGARVVLRRAQISFGGNQNQE